MVGSIFSALCPLTSGLSVHVGWQHREQLIRSGEFTNPGPLGRETVVNGDIFNARRMWGDKILQINISNGEKADVLNGRSFYRLPGVFEKNTS